MLFKPPLQQFWYHLSPSKTLTYRLGSSGNRWNVKSGRFRFEFWQFMAPHHSDPSRVIVSTRHLAQFSLLFGKRLPIS